MEPADIITPMLDELQAVNGRWCDEIAPASTPCDHYAVFTELMGYSDDVMKPFDIAESNH